MIIRTLVSIMPVLLALDDLQGAHPERDPSIG
jgi:hypothetical protein